MRGIKKYIETPEKMWQLNLPQDKKGNYIIVPKKKSYSGITINNEKKYPNGYIYFIKCIGTDMYKLGVSSNPKRRICDIDSYLPFDLQILSLHFFENVYEIEKLFTKTLINKNIKREWYKLSVDEASEIIIDLHNLNIEKDASDKNI